VLLPAIFGIAVADQVLRDGEVTHEDRPGEFLARADPPDPASGLLRTVAN